MKDGIISGNGNSRYLKTVAAAMELYPTYQEFLQALIAGTFPIDLNGINNAGWSQLGTPLNKGNLLSDNTETRLWGSAGNHTVDQALGRILSSTGYNMVKEYTSPGSYTHTFDRKYTDVFVVVVGAGGGGGSSGERGGGGGGGGAVACFHVLDSSTIQNNNIVVGTGGAGAVSSLGPSVTNNGSAGGSSSAFGITVPGGSGGIANLGGMGGGYAPNEIVPGWLMIGGSGGGHNNNGDGDGNAGPIISIVGFKPFGGGGGGGGNPSLNDPPTPGGNGGDGGAGNGGAGATGQSNAIMGKNGTRGGGGGGGGAGWTFRSSEYKPSGIGGKGGDGYVAIYARGIS